MENSKALQRLQTLFDDGVFTELDAFAKSSNGDVEVVAGFGSVNGTLAYAFSQNIDVNDGAITVAQCSKIKKVYDLAIKTGCPVVGIYDSNGVQISQGFEVLNAYGEIVKASTSLSGVCPQISIIAGSCIGTSALIANLADIVIANKDSEYYVKSTSPISAEDSFKAGVIDLLTDDVDSSIAKAKELLAVLPSNNLSPTPVFDFDAPSVETSATMTAADLIDSVVDANSSVEIKAGFGSSNCKTAIATICGSTVGVIAFEGKPLCTHSIAKAQSMINLCDAYSIPVITFVNADGVVEEVPAKILSSITSLTSAYATATCPKIAILSGSAIGISYITLAGKGANADLVYAFDSAIASPLDVDAGVAFMFNDRLANGEDRESLKAEFKDTIASPFTAAACGAIDDIFAPADTRAKLISALDILSGKRENTLPRKHSVK